MRNMAGTHSFLIFLTLIIANGCSPVAVQLKGKYNRSPVEITTTQSPDSAWSKLTALFTTNGLPIKSIDRQKGTIISRNAPVNPTYTFEDAAGKLEQPEAWVVLTKVYNKNKEWKPKDMRGQWNIHITETGKGITTIKIDPNVICTFFPNNFTKMEYAGQSTGKLEQLLEQSLKN